MLGNTITFKAAAAGAGSDIVLTRVAAGKYKLSSVAFPSQYVVTLSVGGTQGTTGLRKIECQVDYRAVPTDLNQSSIGRSMAKISLESNYKESQDSDDARGLASVALGLMLNSTIWDELLIGAI